MTERGSVQPDQRATLERFLEMSIDLLAILDMGTAILEASESWERTLGWSPAEVIGVPLLDLFHPDDKPAIDAALAQLGDEGGEAVGVVVRMRSRDGTYRWVQGNARADHAAGRIYVTAADITERMTLETALREQLSLEELVASIAARLIGAEPAQVPAEIEVAIRELAEVLGADRAHFMRGSRHFDEITYIEWLRPDSAPRAHTPAPDPEVQAWWREVLRSGRLLHLTDIEDLADEAPLVVDALRADGVRSVLLLPLPPHRGFWGFVALVAIRQAVHFSDAATSLLRLTGESFMTALAQGDDAAALRDAQRELEHRNEQLEESNEELERFAYSAAHDLKAPLARVEMALSALASATEGTLAAGPEPELLAVARRGAARMRQLIEDLLAFASVGQASGALEPVQLDEVLDHVLADLEPAIAAGGALVERSPLPEVRGHPALLGQLLQNLLANALKYVRPDVAARVRVSAERDGDGVTVTVADNGIGIDPAHRAEVFGVFTRLGLDDASPGSGIGLATCAKVAAHHGGRIWIEDGIEGGTAVRFWLPDAPSAP